MEFFDLVRGGALANAGDYRMHETGNARQKKRSGKGKSSALMLKIGFANRAGMGEKEPREQGLNLGKGEDERGRTAHMDLIQIRSDTQLRIGRSRSIIFPNECQIAIS